MEVRIDSAAVDRLTRERPIDVLWKMMEPLDPTCRIFAPFQVRNKDYVWTLDGEDWTRLSEAEPWDASAVRAKIEDVRVRIPSSLALSPSLVDYILTTPGDEYVFFRKSPSGDVEVQLTGWDFAFPRRPGQRGPVTWSDPAGEQDVRVVFEDSGTPVPSFSFMLTTPSGKEKVLSTGPDGTLYLGRMAPGRQVPLRGVTRSGDFGLVVEMGKDYYRFDVTPPPPPPPRECSLRVDVRTQGGAPAPGTRILVGGIEYTTDSSSAVVVDGLTVGMGVKVKYGGDLSICSDVDLVEGENRVLLKVPDPPVPCTLTVHLLGDGGKPLGEERVEVSGREYVTSSSGEVVIRGLARGEEVRAVYVAHPEVNGHCTVAGGENTIVLLYKEPVVVVPPPQVRIRVLDRNGDPVRNTPLRFKTRRGPLEQVSDEEGWVYFPADLFTPGEKVRLSFEYMHPPVK